MLQLYLEVWKGFKHIFYALWQQLLVSEGEATHLEILQHRETSKNLPALGDEGYPPLHHLVWLWCYRFTMPQHFAVSNWRNTEEGLEYCALAGSIGPHECHNLSIVNFNTNTIQSVHTPIVNFYVFEFQQYLSHELIVK